MDLPRLQILKEKLLVRERKEPLNEVWRYFTANLGDRAWLSELGTIVEHPLVEELVRQIGEQLYPANAQLHNFRLRRIAEWQFVHGVFSMGGRNGVVIYFEDVQIGLFSVPDGGGSNEVKYAKFSTLRDLPKRQPDPSVN